MKKARKSFPKGTPRSLPLKAIRLEIDSLDDQILSLLNKRAKAALKIGKLKKKHQLKFYAPEREKQILDRLEHQNKKFSEKFPTQAVQRVFREIISASLSLERPLRVAFLGPKATFTHLACMEHFGLSAEMVAVRSIKEIFEEVEHGRVDYGVVPIENSTEGMVTHTLDLFVQSPLKIIAEKAIEVEHHLLAKKKKPLSSIELVVSHAQALAQCRNWLDKNLHGVAIKEVDSTGMAAQMAMDDERIAAVASTFAANYYQLKICRQRIQDQVDNFTRFLILGFDLSAPTGEDKTSILFSVRNQPGALYKMLKPFYENEVNMTKIESRPLKTKIWEYVFFIDVDGHIEETKVAKAIAELEKRCHFLRVLGSYPKVTVKRGKS